jgi:release factor glutamine methyltransferase
MSMSVGQALAQCGLTPIDAQVLLAHVVARNRAWLAAHRTDALSREHAEAFFALAKRRRDGEPVAYLTGLREFFGLPLRVTPDVLIPRPETETLVELVLEWLPSDRAVRVLDIGTGSGAIALAIAKMRPDAQVVATDVSPAALAVARGNAAALGLANVEFVESDFYSRVHATPFDVIASNPPYVAATDPHLDEGDVRFEPKAALVPRGDELAALRAVITGAPQQVAPGGAVVVEHGYAQSDAVQALLRASGFSGMTERRDLAGIPRVAAGRRV